jgi:D-aminopeptidase
MTESAAERPRVRDLGVAPGLFPPGRLNALTDVAGVRVGHATMIEGERVRTGVTAILPHAGNAFLERVPAGLHVGNGFGKFTGATQIAELGEIETPVLLTSTLSAWKVADALVEWMLGRPGMEGVHSLNPIVGECNDSQLSDGRARPVTAAAVRQALEAAQSPNGTGPVAEGCVGAGTGTVAFGWKAGIGTASRALPASLGGFTLGVLVQSNFGGVLQVQGAPVGRRLGRYAFERELAGDSGDGSVVMVLATDAPLSERNLRRLGARAMMGLARTGSSAANGSGDYAIAFSTAPEVRRIWNARRHEVVDLGNGEMSGLFQAAVEATEEAILNSLLRATTMTGNGRTVEALPIDRLQAILSGERP